MFLWELRVDVLHLQRCQLFPCGTCQYNDNVGGLHLAVACDSCDVWYHKSCISMTSVEYAGIEDQSWKCYCCRSVNNASFIYHPFNLEVSNRFSPLSDIPGDDSVFINNNEEIISPTAVDFAPPSASSPIIAGTHI